LTLRPLTPRLLKSAPPAFDGTLEELFEQFIEPNLPAADAVERLHLTLLEYCNQAHPVFVVRSVTGLERRRLYETSGGERLKPSDNAPAWLHFVAFSGQTNCDLEEMPTHMFDVRLPTTMNAAGWHVAHILNTKDYNTDWRHWSRDELTRRFIRNVHPCNCFYVPKTGWHAYGSDPGVISFFASLYAERYAAVWNGFLHAAGGVQPLGTAAPRYIYTARNAPQVISASNRTIAASYRYSRLCFKAVIEPLAMEATFEVITPVGTFRMTKADFHRDFPNVVQGNSYRNRRIYHYPKTPGHALKYKS
jgi:hypothetical protein